MELRKCRQPKMWCSLRGLKARMVSDEEAVLHGKISGIYARCILVMSGGETESTFGGIGEGAGLGYLGGGVAKGSGIGYLVVG